MSNGCSAKELVLWEVLLRNQSHPNRLCVFFWVYVLNTCSFGLGHSYVLYQKIGEQMINTLLYVGTTSRLSKVYIMCVKINIIIKLSLGLDVV